MDPAVPAVRLPPAVRSLCVALCALALIAAGAPPAGALALDPAPVRLSTIGGRPVWALPNGVRLNPPPGRWGGAWAGAGPLVLPILPGSAHGRT